MRQKLKFESWKGGFGADSWGTYVHPWPKIEVLELIQCLFSLLLFYRSPDVYCGCKWFTFAAENIKAVVAIYQFLLLYSELTGLPSPWFSSNHHHELYLSSEFSNLSSAYDSQTCCQSNQACKTVFENNFRSIFETWCQWHMFRHS